MTAALAKFRKPEGRYLAFQVADATPHEAAPGYQPADAARAVRYRAWLYGYRLPRRIEPVYQFHKPSGCWVWRLELGMGDVERDPSQHYTGAFI